MTTAAIVGAGDIGGAAAHALASSAYVRRVLLVDDAAQPARGKALDLLQAGAITRGHTSLEGTADLAAIAGCSVCVVADRIAGGEWRGDDGLALVGRLLPYLGTAPLVFAGASHAELIARVAAEAGIDRRRLLGSSAEALASAARAIVAVDAECSVRDVSLAVLGRPPDGLVVPWTDASIGGRALPAVLPQAVLARLEARVRHLWPPGPYALGVAAARLVDALLASSPRLFHVITQLVGEFGVRNRVGVLPARLVPRGIRQAHVPDLTGRERVQVEIALGG